MPTRRRVRPRLWRRCVWIRTPGRHRRAQCADGGRRVKPRRGSGPSRHSAGAHLRVERRRRRSWAARRALSPVDRVDHRAQRRGDDRRVDADAPDDLAVDVRLDVRGRGRVLASAHRVLVVVAHVHLTPKLARDASHERVDRPVALALDDPLLAVDAQARGDPVAPPSLESDVRDELERRRVRRGSARGTSSSSSSAVSSPPRASAIACTFCAKSTWSPRGRSRWCSPASGTPPRPCPDCEFTRMIASYVRPTSFGSIGRYGTSQTSEPDRSCACIPFLIASWCEPENAV